MAKNGWESSFCGGNGTPFHNQMADLVQIASAYALSTSKFAAVWRTCAESRINVFLANGSCQELKNRFTIQNKSIHLKAGFSIEKIAFLFNPGLAFRRNWD
jgi:hypothetical protein